MVLILTQKAVLYHPPHDKMHKKGFMISFDTIFQILRPKYNPETKSFGPSHGIKFHCPNFEAQEFYNDNAKEVEKWEIECKVLMSEFNFHDLFKAEKRLGKGNFATVYLGMNLKEQRKVAIKAFGKEATFSQ